MKVTDQGPQARSDTQVLYININRNLNAPFFGVDQRSFSVRILETRRLRESIQTVSATDLDEEVGTDI